MRVIVIGGGIGGVTATIALRRKGIEAVAYERAPDLHAIQVGAGVFLWSNAFNALDQVGLRDAVYEAGSEIGRMDLRSAESGQMLLSWDVAAMSRKIGAPTVGVARPDLHDALLSQLEPDALVLGAECVSVLQDGDGVTAVFADGTEQQADALIGADGGRSTIRELLLGPATFRDAGYVAWRGIVDEPMPILPPGESLMLFGRGASLFIYRVKGERPYWLAFTRVDEGDPGVEDKAGLVETFRTWYGPGREVIEATPAEAINRRSVAEYWTPSWAHGRVLLVGDAAHLFSPNLGQGACQAIEDAVTVAKLLAGGNGVPEAFQEFERVRRPHTQSIFRRASLLGRIRRWRSRFFCTARDYALRLFIHRIETRFHLRDISHTV